MSVALTARLNAGFALAFGGAPDGVVRAPGRVNLIGEHTDYNDGFVLPMAIGPETQIAWRATGSREIDVVALDFAGERDSVRLDAPVAHAPGGGWRDYVRAMIAELRARGVALDGGELAIAGSIDRGSGLSSSASLEVALCHALLAAAGGTMDATAVAQAAQAAENDFVGMRCGVMDQLASAAGRADAALLIDCRALRISPVPIPPDAAVMIVQSGVVRGLVDGHYNARRRECEAAARALGVAALRDADLASLAARRGAMAATEFRRARHVITENMRTLAAAEALERGDIVALGRLMAESHASMRDDFEISVPAVDRLVAIAQAAIGEAGGARMTGGGFGGAIVAVLPRARADAVSAAIARDYRTPAGQLPSIRIESASAGAGSIS